MSQFIIKFSKWKDGFKNFLKHAKKQEENIDFDSEDFDTAEQFQELNGYQGPIIMTDFGAIPLNETTLPSTNFNFWRGDTNFPLNIAHKMVIDTMLGIETVNFYTPYRFRVAIAPLFDEKSTLKNLEIALTNASKELYNIKEPKVDVFSKLKAQYSYYAMVNNKVFHGNSAEEVDKQVNSFLKENPNTSVRYSYK